MTAQATYTAHVVRGSCCTGGRLCPVGRVLLLGAKAEEARTEYLGYGAVIAQTTEFHATEKDWAIYSCDSCMRLQLRVEAMSISLDLAAAEASVERARLASQ